MVEKWQNELSAFSSDEKAKVLSGFFKTGKGEYGEGDIFAGITVPDNRKVSQKYFNAPFDDISTMLHSPIHEFRLAGFLALVERYRKMKDADERKATVDFYLQHSLQANNWDLVDLSAPKILGEYLKIHPAPALLDSLSNKPSIWQQRIAIVATYTLIKINSFDDTLRLAERYLSHTHPLMHKATGWMLREVGKRDNDTLIGFLDRHAGRMPRTALRYSIEKLTPPLRAHYMNMRHDE